MWIVGFCGGDPHQFKAAEGEHDDRHHHHQPADAVRQETALVPQVADAGLWAAVAAKQQPAAKQDHTDDRHHFDNREPELHLTEHFDVGQVDGVDHHKEDSRSGPGGEFRPPELNIFADGREFSHRHQHIQHPVVPAGGKAGKVAPVFIGEVAKAASHRLFHHHFAELAHDQEGNKTGDGIAENHGRTGRFNH